MVFYKKIIRFLRKHKSEYFFGFGADSQAEMIEAIIGRKPEFIGSTILHDYQLCIQNLEHIPTTGANPREILRRAWGDGFRSFTIRHHEGGEVEGSIFKMTSYERKMLDAWELVSEGWQDSIIVKVSDSSGNSYKARTQALPKGHDHGQSTEGIKYNPWLMPKEDFLRIAGEDNKRYDSYVY